MKQLILLLISLCLAFALQGQVAKTIAVTSGTLGTTLTATELSTITELTLTGTIDARDFKTMRDNMPALAVLDLSEVSVAFYRGTEGTEGDYITDYLADAIPIGAFYDMEQENGKASLTTVTLPLNLITIGTLAFTRCSHLTTVSIPLSVTTIGDNTFTECVQLADLHISATLTTIGSGAFMGSGGPISVDDGNPAYVSVEGVLYDKNLSTLIYYPVSGPVTFNIPSTVKRIESGAFWGCTALTSVALPSSITSIGNMVFYNCMALTSIIVHSPYPLVFTNDVTIFYGIKTSACNLHVPYGAKDNYSAAEQWKEFNTILEAPIGFSLDANTLKIEADAPGSSTIPVTANVEWTANYDQTWLTVQPISGTGNATLTITAEANQIILSRSAEITFSSAGFDSQTLTVIQEGQPKTISITPGGLLTALADTELSQITNLTLTGRMDARDFRVLRDRMPNLSELNMEGVSIVVYSGENGTSGDFYDYYDANTIPPYAFSDPYTNQGKQGLTSVVLPPSLNIIGRHSFADCKDLVSLNIPSSVTTILSGAFMDCVSLVSLNLPASVFTLEYEAFANCSAMFMVAPGNINFSSQEGVLFNFNRTSLIQCPTSKTGEYIIPSTVMFIEYSAFKSCTNLTTVVFPASVNSVEYAAFDNCSALFSVSNNNPYYSSLEGVLYNKNQTSLIIYPASKAGSLIIPSSVTTISARAFYGCGELTSVNIPASVTDIGDYAFEGCSSLTSIIVHTPYPIDISEHYGVFDGINMSYCTLRVPYGASRFYSVAPLWKAFTTIEEESDGFILSTLLLSMDSVGGSNSTVSIQANVSWTASSDQAWLTVDPASGAGDNSITFTATPNTSVELRTATVTFSAAGLPSQTIAVNQGGITKTVDVTTAGLLSTLLAEELEGITNLTITGTIDARDFKTMRDNMTALAVLDMSDAVIAAYQGFEGTVDFQSDYPSNGIPISAFSYLHNYIGKTSLRTVLLPTNLQSIGTSAFRGCTGLTSIVIPSSVTSMENEAFSYCTGLTSIVAKSSIPIDLNSSYAVFSFVNYLNCILQVPYGSKDLYVTAYQWRDFRNIVEDSDGFKLSTTVLTLSAGEGSNGTLEINANKAWILSFDQSWLTVNPTTGTGNQSITFTATANALVTQRTAIVNVSAIDEDVQQIAVHQMGLPLTVNITAGGLLSALTAYERNNINDLTITGTIDARDFKTMRDEMPLLARIDLSGATIVAYVGEEGTGYLNVYPANEIPMYAFHNNLTGKINTSLTTIMLPSTTTSIREFAFQSCQAITSMSIPAMVTTIGNGTFFGCSAMTSVSIPPDVTSIGGFAFADCIGLTAITIPSMLTKIEFGVFSGCKALSSVILPSSIDSIGSNAFVNCISLESIILPSSLTFIGEYAFVSCSNLTSISIPSSVTSIDMGAFMGCSSLTTVDLASPLTSLKRSTFQGCSKLTSVSIPSSVTSIEDLAFWGCTSLTSVIIPSSVVHIGDGAFWGCNTLTTITLPSSIQFIGGAAFSNCTGLSSIYAYRSIPVDLTQTLDVFSLVDKDSCTLIVGYNARERYASADQWKDFINIQEETEGLHLDSLSLYYPSTGGSIIVNATANVAWTTSSDQSWLTVDPSSGTGDQALTFTAEANTIAAMRNAIVTVSATGYSSQIVTITQPGIAKNLELTAGGLLTALTAEELKGITTLTITGTIDARDFKTIRDEMPLLASLDLSGARIAAYTGTEGTVSYNNTYSANQVPREAFYTNDNWEAKANLISLLLPTSITSIGMYALNALTGLTTLIIPSSVTSMEGGAIAGCSNLTSLYANPRVPVDLTNSNWVFEGINLANCTLYVPAGSKELYRAAYLWQDFYIIVEGPVGIRDGMETATQIKCYPNPFTQQVAIEIQNQKHEKVTVDIYNMSGQRVKNLTIDNRAEKITLSWNGTNEQGQQMVPGMYIFKVNEEMKKIIKR